MEFLLFGLIMAICGFVAGYFLCSVATWGKVHRQESNIRALSNNIEVLKDMDGEVPTVWVQDQLETMLVKDYR